MGKLVDLKGQRFGRLLVLEELGRSSDGGVLWLCQCDCGKKKVVRRHSLKAGTKSCGCFWREKVALFGERNNNWKGNQANQQAGRHRAKRWFKEGLCDLCGKSAHDRHHKDGNTLNNSPSNVQLLCRRCHMKEDGRLDNFRTMDRDYMKRGEDGRFLAFGHEKKSIEKDENQREGLKA